MKENMEQRQSDDKEEKNKEEKRRKDDNEEQEKVVRQKIKDSKTISSILLNSSDTALTEAKKIVKNTKTCHHLNVNDIDIIISQETNINNTSKHLISTKMMLQ